MNTLQMALDALDRFEELRPVLADLGRRHVTYGVEPYQYERLRSALLWALGQALGPGFDQETRAAWDQLLSTIAAVMLEAASAATMPIEERL
jgi:hemoglobin-like flavoprotein